MLSIVGLAIQRQSAPFGRRKLSCKICGLLMAEGVALDEFSSVTLGSYSNNSLVVARRYIDDVPLDEFFS